MDPKYTLYAHMDYTRRPDYVSMNKNMNEKIEIIFISLRVETIFMMFLYLVIQIRHNITISKYSFIGYTIFCP
jgi:hypothetical protein